MWPPRNTFAHQTFGQAVADHRLRPLGLRSTRRSAITLRGCIRFLGQLCEQCEGLYRIDVEAFHDDALRLTDDVAAGQGRIELPLPVAARMSRAA